MDIKEVTRVIKEKFPFRSLPTSMNVIVNKADLEKFMSLSNIDQETISAYTNYIFSYVSFSNKLTLLEWEPSKKHSKKLLQHEIQQNLTNRRKGNSL